MTVKSRFSSLRNRNFRLYCIGQVISVSGTFMQTLAQAWLVLKLTGSGTALGLVIALQYLPILLLAPLGGVLADRLSKRRVLYATQASSGVLALILGVLVATGAVRLWMVYALALGLGLVNSVDNPTRQSFILEMVGRDDVRNAVTLYAGTGNITRVVGSALAGILISTVGLAPCFLLNGLSYVAVLAGLMMMRDSELHTSDPASNRGGGVREGFRYAMSNPVIRDTITMIAVIGTFTFEFQVSLPLMAQFAFNGDAVSYSALMVALGVGAVLGGLYLANLKDTTHERLAKVSLLFGASVLLTAAMPTLILACLALVIVGAYTVYFQSLASSLLQLESDPQMRGRIMSLWSVAYLGSTAVGGPIIGWIGETLGPRIALAAGGIAAMAAAGWAHRTKTT